jgi:hypothetical protein
MTSRTSIKEEDEESNSILGFNKRPRSIVGDWTSQVIDTQQERLVVGPDGNKILCDSPVLSELPPYAAPDEADISNKKNISRQVNTTRRSISSERSKPRRVIGNYTLINTLGSGSMGKVRLAVHNITGDKVSTEYLVYIQLLNNSFNSLQSRLYRVDSRQNTTH